MEFKLENPDKHDKKREELKGKVINLPELVDYADGTRFSLVIS